MEAYQQHQQRHLKQRTQNVNAGGGVLSRALAVDGDARELVLGLQGYGVDDPRSRSLVGDAMGAAVPDELSGFGLAGILHAAGELERDALPERGRCVGVSRGGVWGDGRGEIDGGREEGGR